MARTFFLAADLSYLLQRAKMMISFINGDGQKPQENTKDIEQWIRTYCMVSSWILNSISKEVVESFMYTNTSRDLWVELENRFGQSNGPLEYQLKKELASTSQGSMTVSTYFARLKKLWEELACITRTPECTCEETKETAEIKIHDQVIQFLMGLNEVYDHVRGQAFKRLETQKPFQNKKNTVDKRNEIRKECDKSRHLKEVLKTETNMFLVGFMPQTLALTNTG
ncbi:uncharacterized protein LOC105179789 [Sesamum indicum]|uniref:Uncharacterized protein LOC105179789 n=1 Tax=Sesamum indicum TaxID=4182 RepID=A0A6I9UMF9_SESIN|nr:uncharacterized protein LOC105179789 [Sesamum indicum]